jgi:hypothetical protein
MALRGPFVRPSADEQLNLGPFSAIRQQRGRTRKIFIIKQRSQLPSTSAAGRKVRRILMFDDHPDSVRLVFGGRSHPHVDLSAPQRVSPWELLIVSILTIAGLTGMFWTLV